MSHYTPQENTCKDCQQASFRKGRGRILLLLLLFFLLSFPAFPQSAGRQVTGRVTDAKTGKGVSYVTCKTLGERDSLMAYALTDGTGAFTLTLPDGAEAVEFTLMGYDKKRIGARDARQGMRVRLTPSGIMLKEVTVKARPIDIHKDTINYNVAAFQGKEDRYIEDVLKKMPGIEVADNGAIRYKGRPINKFNIEGQDLLGNQYNQATRNIPADAVATVQVMEDDQPIRALKDRVPSNRATLNLKLKQGYKLRPFGEVKGGLGGFGGVLWNNALTLINVGRKNQMLLTAKMNNNGENLSGDTKEHIDYADNENYEPLPPEMTVTAGTDNPPISERRYLRNKSYSIGLNHLRRIGRYGSLRTNITYYGTSDHNEDSTYNYYGGEQTLSLSETNRRKLSSHTLMPHFRYEHNAPKVYLVDELSGSLSFFKLTSDKLTSRQGDLTQQESNDVFEQTRDIFKSTSDELTSKQGEMPRLLAGQISSSARQLVPCQLNEISSSARDMSAYQLRESADRHPGYLQNKLRMTINAGANVYSVNSLFRYFRRSETLAVGENDGDAEGNSAYSFSPYSITPSSIYQLSQRLELERLMTRSSVSTIFRVLGNSLELKYTFELRSDNVAVDGNRGYRTTYMKHSFMPGYSIVYGRGHIGIEVPVSVFTSRVPWSGVSGGTKVYASPSLRWRHEFSPFWRMNIMGGISRDPSADVMTPEEFARDYRTRLLTADRIGWTRRSGASFSLNYSNLVTLFVWNLMASASWSTSDHYNEYTYGNDLTTVRPVWQDMKSRSLFVMTSVDKTFAGTGGAVKATLTYNRTTLPVAQNGVTADITANVLTTAMTLRWSRWKWLSVTDRPTFNLTWQDPYAWSSGHNTLKSFYNEANIHLFPLSGLDISLSWEYNVLEVERGRYRRNSFLDASVRYSLSKKIDLRLAMSNLLNRKVYEEASFSGLNYGYFSLPLRGREVLFSVAFSI